MPPKPLALCITDLDTGGAERCLTELAVRTERRRFAPVVYCLSARPSEEEKSCLPRLAEAGVPVHFLGGRSVWQFAMVLRRLKFLLRLQKPRILTTFMFHANVLGRIAGRQAGVGHVVCGIRVAERSARWHLWLDKFSHRLVDRYVCVSQSVADFSATQAGLPREKLVVIPNGINLARYPAPKPADLASLQIPPGSPVATFVGRLEPQKGLHWLLETMPLWLAKAENAHLLLVGDGTLRESLAAKARGLGFGEKVHFSGWRPDVAEILAASTLLVLPSRWEGMPNVVLEAMASGKPVVATEVEGVRELLGPLVSGQTVMFGDTTALAVALQRLLSNNALAAETGAENRRRAESHFDIAGMVLKYEALWEELAT